MASSGEYMLGPERLPAGTLDAAGSLTMIMNHYGGLPMDSVITRWNAYIGRIATIYFQIWRPVTGNKFTLVWQSTFTPTKTGINAFDVEVSVYAKEGDYIAFRYIGLGVIPFNMASCGQSVFQESRWYFAGLNSVVGNTYTFSSSLTQCRLYSINVIGLKGE